jgi:glutaminyl-peptide cyclotransferase
MTSSTACGTHGGTPGSRLDAALHIGKVGGGRVKGNAMIRLLLTAVMLAACSPQAASQPPATQASAPAPPPDRLYGYEVVKAYPHDRNAFTQGLFWLDGYLYESTGRVDQSGVRKVRLETGEVMQKRDLPAPYFGEGIVNFGGKLHELTWQHQKAFTYDLATFAPQGEWTYTGEGWGLTQDGRQIIMSDGTPDLRFIDPATMKETRRVRVTFQGQPIGNLNELEFIKGEVWANVWMTDVIVRIDPATGYVVGRILLNDLLKPEDRRGSNPDVLNGIAYDAATDRIFVTGKLWPRLYEIRVVERAG